MTSYDALQKLKGSNEMQKYLDDLEQERQMLYMTDEERARAIELIKAQKMLESNGYSGDELQIKLSGYDKAMKQLNETKKRAETLKSVASDLSNNFGDAFESIVLGTKTLSQAFQQLALDIEKTLLHDLVTKNITDALAAGITSIGSSWLSALYGGSSSGNTSYASGDHVLARGGVFDSTGMTAFAAGGIVHSPTMFRFANGTGLMGEAGPEAIMPLSRGSDGKLGVRSQSSSTQVPPITFNVINNSSQPVKATPGDTTFDGKQYVQSVILNDLDSYGPIHRKLKTM
jgi:hypothetical protein